MVRVPRPHGTQAAMTEHSAQVEMTDFDSTQRTRGDGGLAGSGWGAEVVKAGVKLAKVCPSS